MDLLEKNAVAVLLQMASPSLKSQVSDIQTLHLHLLLLCYLHYHTIERKKRKEERCRNLQQLIYREGLFIKV
jgi:hypothetical protein